MWVFQMFNHVFSWTVAVLLKIVQLYLAALKLSLLALFTNFQLYLASLQLHSSCTFLEKNTFLKQEIQLQLQILYEFQGFLQPFHFIGLWKSVCHAPSHIYEFQLHSCQIWEPDVQIPPTYEWREKMPIAYLCISSYNFDRRQHQRKLGLSILWVDFWRS